jgi:hypothetical protein
MAKGKRLKDGHAVLDGRVDLEFTVTPEDIVQHRDKDPGGCAAAHGCMRTFSICRALVYRRVTYLLFPDNKWHRYMTSESLRNELIAVDRGGKFLPGWHTLKAPSKHQRLGRHKPTGPHKNNGERRQVIRITRGIRDMAPKF